MFVSSYTRHHPTNQNALSISWMSHATVGTGDKVESKTAQSLPSWNLLSFSAARAEIEMVGVQSESVPIRLSE